MKFSTDLNITDLALGLTAVASGPEVDDARLNDIRSILARESHDTIFDKAQEICAEYGGTMRIEELSHEEMFMQNVQGFAVAQTTKGWVCALWGGADGPIMPKAQADITNTAPPPAVWLVFRAYSLVVH